MKTKNLSFRKINWKKIAGTAVLGAFAIAPVVAVSTPGQAQYSQRGNDRDWDRNRNSQQTLEGVVVNDRPGRLFSLRLDNGRQIQVYSDEREPRGLDRGDRVRVRGTFNNSNSRRGDTRYNDRRSNDRDTFRASDVQILRRTNSGRGNYGNYGNYGHGNNGNYGATYGRSNLVGVVTNVKSDQRLGVRVDGRDFEVYSPARLQGDIRRGDYVRIYGDVRGDTIDNASVTLDRGYNDRYDSRGSSGGILDDIFNGRFGGYR